MAEALWEACRSQSRPGLDALAQRIEPAATWDDLVLPERELELLRGLGLTSANARRCSRIGVSRHRGCAAWA